MKFAFLLIFSWYCSPLQAQKGYAVNDITGDFPISRILNHSTGSSSFGQFKNRVLIVDFFGTWCVPCIKALPKLTALQIKYKNDINILLVSEEPVAKLENFIQKQSGFIFPVAVDGEGNFTKLFLPPSYPYTVVVGKNGKVIAIPSADEMTETNIDKWLKEQEEMVTPANELTNKNPPLSVSSFNNGKSDMELSKNELVQLSQEFIYAARTGEPSDPFISRLENLSIEDLVSVLKTDDDKKAFWINLYNAYTQVILKKDPGQYKTRGKFFGNKQIRIAGYQFSLDDIEHDILRRSKIKWSLGHFNKLFPGKTEKKLRVNELDYRLHFALNCGAKSCPPIAYYRPESIDGQLELATKVYLGTEAKYDEKANMLELPALMGWFRRDFGGKKKMTALLIQIGIVPPGKDPRIRFKSYDWTLYLQNYKL